MDRISFASFARRCCQLTCVGLLGCMTSIAGAAADQRCQQLEALHRQYAGVSLTASQKQLKRKLVAWYRQNCTRSRRAEVRR